MNPNNAMQASTTLHQKLVELSKEPSECTIYRVHGQLRNVNPATYEPQIISIGPYHRHKHHLKMMKDYKLRFFQELILESKERCNVETYVETVAKSEMEARKCYADQPTSLPPNVFIEMLVLDGCFIIQLVRKYEKKNDPIFRMNWMVKILLRDLMLFENQLPFFILCDLFDLIEGPKNHDKLLSYLFNIFGCHREVQNADPRSNIKHLLEFIYLSLLPPPFQETEDSNEMEKEKRLEFINTATWLKTANVKFKKKEGATLFEVEFKDGVLLMPPLTIEDITESFLRNLIAYEQYFRHDQHNFVTEYAVLLDSLIDSSKDVELLSRKGIIENWLGDDEIVARFVNQLVDSVTSTDDQFFHYYARICENVNKHCSQNKNKWMAKLRRDYLHSPWAIISVFAAVLLLLLTITQTVFTILQEIQKK